MKITFSGLFALLAFSLPVIGENVTFTAGTDFQISLPEDWEEIPKAALEQFQKEVSEVTGENLTYEYGYQSTKTENWFEYPYALVQIKRTGRIPEGQLKNYIQIESGFEEGIKKLEETASNLFSDISQDETIYEPGIHALWTVITMDVEGVGKARGLVAFKLTEYGYIQITAYALAQEFTRYEPLYRRMVHSITLDEKEVYKSRLTDNAPSIFGINLGQTAIAAIAGALIAGLFGMFKIVRRNIS